MMTYTTKECSYKAEGTPSYDLTQQNFDCPMSWLLQGATYAFAMAMKSAFPPNCCVGSHVPVISVALEPSFVVHIIMPSRLLESYVCHA